MATTTAQASQVTEKDISAWADAKRRLQLRRNQLLTLKARAVKSGNTKLVMQLDADLKEATALAARAASVDAMLAPFLKAWQWAKEKIGLGDLGLAPLVVGIGVTGALTAVIYAINVFDRKMETSADKYNADLDAHDAWVKRGKTGEQASQIVEKKNEQFTEETKNDNKPGLFEQLQGMIKIGGVLLLIGGGWYLYNNGKKPGNRSATN